MNIRRVLGATAAALSLALSACGGGGGVGGTGVGGDDVAYGTITGFGSVWVNGVRYDASNSAILRDEGSVTQSALRIGMVARVEGSIADQQAAVISVDSAIKGRVEQVIDANRLRVMGQSVEVDETTLFENGQRPVAGDYVEIHGLPVAEGVIRAGYVERKTTLASPPYVVTGFVSGHDSAARTFRIGGLNVGYAAATVDDLPASGWNGLLVEVKGTACAGNPVCGTLSAGKVERGGPDLGDADEAEFEGFVTALGADGFFLGGQQVRVGSGTQYEGGAAVDIAVGVKLEVEGMVSGGVLVAAKVEFKDSVRIEANVGSNSANGLTLQGLGGITVQANALTELKDVGSVGALMAGHHVRIRGRVGPGNGVIATQIELRSTAPDERVELRGPVDRVASPMLTILGVDIDTSTIDDDDFKGADDLPIGRAAFFAGLVNGQSVEAQGELVGAAVVWKELEMED